MNKYTKRYKNFDEFCKEIKTMDELLKWYKANNVQWPKVPKSGNANDRPMSWPDNLVRTKTGLCWDHAIFMHYFCKKHNIDHKIMHIRTLFEVQNYTYVFGHVIGIYIGDNGINFFDITGYQKASKEFGPFKSYNEAIETYVNWYTAAAYNYLSSDSNVYKIYRNPYYYVFDSNEYSQLFDRYYNNYKIKQTKMDYELLEPVFIKKYGSDYSLKDTDKLIFRSPFEILSHGIKNFISEYIGSPLVNLANPKWETGLMGSTGGAVMGVYGRPFVSQIMSSTFVRPKYALHDDIFTDNILTTNDSDTLQMMSSDYLKDKKVRVFKYVGKNPKDKMKKLLESVGKEVNREYIYEELSGKDMINDDQIYIDEDFEEIKFDEVKASIENEAYTVLNKYMNTSPTLASRYSIVNTQEASFKLKNHSESVVIMEHVGLGYFACNRNTMRRTKYYSNINDIVIGSDIDG